ncbi:MAG: MotA/TolQ/ExbB proton channel family protein [Chitinophagales bacterium]|nr:MotA/TolQ/ExbB proton channel family protein [Chitinophagales bacterium]
MKKLLRSFLASLTLIVFNTAVVLAQAEEADAAAEEAVQGHQLLMKWFVDGGPVFMSIVLICLILGLAFAIERIIVLTLASTNTKKLLSEVESNLEAKNIEGAKEICKSSKSPIADIIYQGLERSKEGMEVVEKSVVAYGSVQMGILEKGLIWISLFIALAPMLGFMGTVIGMVNAFDAIESAGDINPRIVASGIKVALLTTLFGLIVAVILQIFYNYIVSRIDGIVNDMEDASISFVDMLVKHGIVSHN